MTVCSEVNVGTAGKSTGTGPRNAESTKGICMVYEQVKAKGAMPAMVAPIRHEIFAALKGIIKPSTIRRIPRRHLNGGETRL